MLLTVAIWLAISSAAPAQPSTDVVDCLWRALPPDRQEALMRLPYDPVLERRIQAAEDLVPVAETEAVTSKCGGRGVEHWVIVPWAIQAAARRAESEGALQPGYPAGRLDTAFAPLRGAVEEIVLGDQSDFEGIEDLVAHFEARFEENLGEGPPEADRSALHRYVEARVEGELANLLWRQMSEWQALSPEEQNRIMTRDAGRDD